ncbi:hypothetical protein GW17_00056199 [Ensete ventricosum]|nr:hypothetical protein GW17_00056199 [Ensete ventricosum]RZR85777.1 hypothetical protein BHM03_00012815 [Ensete ventricosum]
MWSTNSAEAVTSKQADRYVPPGMGPYRSFACRDYPHPRHLCAHFPFSSSPHEKFCDLVSPIHSVQKLRESRVADALTTQLMNSHRRFKRAGTMQNRFTSLNNRLHNTIASSNHTSSAVLQKSTYATRTSQKPRSPQVGQPRYEDMLVTSPGASADQMQANISSLFTLPTKQSSMCPPVTAADDSQESWQNILASVASELGVSMCSNTGTSEAQQRPLFPSSSLPYSRTDASRDTWSVPANTNFGSLDYDCRWSNDTMAQTQEHSPVEDPHL